MEAEAESTALLVGSDKLENKFAALESGSGGWALAHDTQEAGAARWEEAGVGGRVGGGAPHGGDGCGHEVRGG